MGCSGFRAGIRRQCDAPPREGWRLARGPPRAPDSVGRPRVRGLLTHSFESLTWEESHLGVPQVGPAPLRGAATERSWLPAQAGKSTPGGVA